MTSPGDKNETSEVKSPVEDKKESSQKDKKSPENESKPDSKDSSSSDDKKSPSEGKNDKESSDKKSKIKSPEVSAEKSNKKSKVEDSKQKSKVEDSKQKSKVEGKDENRVKSKIDDLKTKNKTEDQNSKKGKSSKTDSKGATEEEKNKSPSSSESSLAVDSTQSAISRKTKKASKDHVTRVGFMGAGRMTDCIVRGLLKVEKMQAKNIVVAAKSGKNLDSFKSSGIKTTQRSYDLFGKYRCDVIFLCVHGFVVRNCFKMGGTRPFPITTNYIPSRKSKFYVLSMIGGVPLSDVKTVLLNPDSSSSSNAIFHRITLNASVAYGIGLGAIDVEFDSKKCAPVVRDLLNSIAKITTIDEGSMDASCAVMGNGLAIIYYFIAALSDGGFKMGLSKNISIKLAAKVMSVAAMALLESNQNLADLRDACCSPSGPAIYGLAVMEKNDMASGIQSSVEAAYRRIKQLCEVECINN